MTSAFERWRQLPLRMAPPGWRRGLAGVTVEPVGHVVVEELLRPQHPGHGLAQDLGGGVVETAGDPVAQLGVPLVGLGLPGRHHRVPAAGQVRRLAGPRRQAQADLHGGSARDLALVPQRRLGPGARRVHGRGCAPADDVVVDAVFRVRGARGGIGAEHPVGVGLVLAEQQAGTAVADQDPRPEEGVALLHDRSVHRPQPGLAVVAAPGPGVAQPQRRHDVQRRGGRAQIAGGDPDAEVLGVGLGHVGGDLPDAGVEDPGVEQLVLRIEPGAAVVHLYQLPVGERGLWIQIAPPHPRVGRRRVEEKPVLLGVLPVVALGAVETERPLLHDRVEPVPHGEGQAQELMVVTQPGHAVLVPPVGAGAGVVVGEEVPRVAVGAVVLPHGAPGPLGEVRPPATPRDAGVSLGQTAALGGHPCVEGWRTQHRSAGPGSSRRSSCMS